MYTRKYYISIASVLVVIFSTSFLFYLIRWINSSFGGDISFDQLIFYLYVPLKGTSDNLVQEGVSSVVLPSLRILFVAMVGLLVTARKKSEIVLDVQLYTFQKTVVVWPIFIHKRRFWTFLALLLAMVSIYQLQNIYDIGGYIRSQLNTSTFIEDQYVNPHTVDLQFPEKRRNLIYIYLESM